jgi:hypothetical protein
LYVTLGRLFIGGTSGTEQRWNSYIGKEAHYKNNSEVIDYSNTQAPNKILATI